MNWRNRTAILVTVVGLTQMLAHVSGQRWMRGVGLASGIAPYPKVFCSQDGYEAFTATYWLHGTRADGVQWSCKFDPDTYSKIRGPYARRNVYGAALAFAPRLPDDLREHILLSALAPGSKMRRELEIPNDIEDLEVRIISRDEDQTWRFR